MAQLPDGGHRCDVMIGSGRVDPCLFDYTNGLDLMTGLAASWDGSRMLRTSCHRWFRIRSSTRSGATIVTPVPAAGTYNIAWAVGLAGPAALADTNNFQLKAHPETSWCHRR